jgi:hypothetical protein
MYRDLLWPDWVCAWSTFIFPFLPLLNKIGTSNELDAENIVFFFCVLDSCEEMLRLSSEIGLICTARESLVFVWIQIGGIAYKMRGPFQSLDSLGGRLNSSESKRVKASRAG